MSNIKLFAFAKESASTPIYTYCQDKSNEDDFKIEATKVIRDIFIRYWHNLRI